jgi:hypothetical protein
MHSETFYFFLSWYRRSPPSLFVDSIRNPCLPAVDRKPRTLCACHEVACQSRSLGSPDQRQDLASLLSGRGFCRETKAAFLPHFVPVLDRVLRPPRACDGARLRPWGAPFTLDRRPRKLWGSVADYDPSFAPVSLWSAFVMWTSFLGAGCA